MFDYYAYGLVIGSEIALPLPAPPATDREPDVRISVGPVAIVGAGAGGDPPYQIVSPDAIRVYYEGVAGFSIESGARIVVDPDAAGADVWLQHYLLGTCFALLLRQRGYLVLHASAVSHAGRAIAFLGDSGVGKSTLTSSLVRLGYHFLTDDVLPVRVEPETSRAWSGPRQVKLWPDSLEALGREAEGLPSIEPSRSKRLWAIEGAPAPAPVDLGALVVLEAGAAPALRGLSTREAFAHLVRHTYLARSIHATGHAAVHFEQCSTVLHQVPVYHLTRTGDFGDLAHLIHRLEAQLVDRLPLHVSA